MPLDGQRAGVESLCHKIRAQADDLLADFRWQRGRRAVRPARARNESGLTVPPVPLKKLV
jgi:hypothetical protein